MTICDNGHDEICFEGGNCPACELIDEINTLKKDLEYVEEEKKELEKELAEVQS